MSPAYIEIGLGRLALSALLVAIAVGLSLALRLGLGRRLVVASLRMSAQLFLVGLVLEWVFSREDAWLVVAMALAMTGVAGVAAVRRTRRRFPGIFWHSLVSVSASSFLVTGAALTGILEVEPWFDPQYLIPLLGMLLGNSLTGISLALDRFMDGCAAERDRVETLLALGAGRWEAAHPLAREALRTGMVPTLNSMLVMGIVSLPGMMTGQILAGADPADAVRYQIVIMFMIAGTVALAAFGVVMLAYRTLFAPAPRLRTERLSAARE